MKALVTIEVPDDGKCEECDCVLNNFHGERKCEIFGVSLRKDDRALKQCRDAVQRYKEGK